MPLFKKKVEPVIPPVVSAPTLNSSSTINSRSSSRTYVASRDGDPYNAPINQQTSNGYNSSLLADKYSRNKGAGDVYSRGTAELDKDRNELFSGYNPAKSGSGRFFDGPDLGKSPPEGEEDEEDIEGIKQQTRFVKQESVNTTSNALRLAREAEETGRNTLTRIGEQSEKLANTERLLDLSKGYTQQAADKTDEIKQLNRSIFRPVITFNKEAKRAAQQAKLQARYEEEKVEREKVMMDIRGTQQRVGRAVTYGHDDDSEELLGGRRTELRSAQKEQRKRYQFEATESDDELEDRLDDNLDEISAVTGRLKALGIAMGNELDTQNKRIDNIAGKTDRLDDKLRHGTEQLKRIK